MPTFQADLSVDKERYPRKERVYLVLASAFVVLLVLTNILIAGCIPEIKRTVGAPVLVTLQGDDVFLDFLPEPHQSTAIKECRRLADKADGFIVHSEYYADHMSDYLGIPRDRMHIVPLGIDTRDFSEFYPPGSEQSAAERQAQRRGPTIGYLARLAPEKGLHLLVDSFLELRDRPGMEAARLELAGWLGDAHREYAETQFAKLRAAGAGEAFSYRGEVDRRAKIGFLRNLDVLCVPTTYRDPKGLFALEAMAAGVPVVQPDHGAFPELIASTGGGCLTPPDDAHALSETLHALLIDHQRRREYAEAGLKAVHQDRNADTMAQATLEVFNMKVSELSKAQRLAEENRLLILENWHEHLG